MLNKDFWNFSRSNVLDNYGNTIYGKYCCIHFNRKIWFELRKNTWNNQRSIFGDHLKYVYNDITKTYKVRILNYTKRLHAMFELDRNLSHPRNKGEEYHNIDWTDRDETLQ